MEKIQPGKYVAFGYDLYAVEADGTEKKVYNVNPEDPEKIIFGVTQGVIEPLEKALDGLEKDSKFNVTATSEESFGPYDPEKVVTLEKELFLVDDKFDDEVITPGAVVPMMTADGFRINGIVKEVTDKDVVMDFNHPLAGKSVRFDGVIFEVRDATPEELHPATSCGCGCGCSDAGCSDGACDCSSSADSACGCGCK